LTENYNNDDPSRIPAQWQRFGPWIGNSRIVYGVISETGAPGTFDYLCGIEVTDLASIPAGLVGLRIPPQKYAVFTHRDHISKIRNNFHAIFDQWLPNAGYKRAKAPVFERYDERFDPRTGLGVVEIWVPV
jgi:AraC family transcriptional regulator